MLKHLSFFYLLIKLTGATLSPPKDSYSDDGDQNYLYEQACYQSATEYSNKYESPIVRSKMFHTHYAECLSSIWPGCEVVNTKDWIVSSYRTFKINDRIARDMNNKPKYAHKPGFSVEELLAPENQWLIFWDPSKPETDIERFNKIKFATPKELHDIHFKNIITGIKKFQNAGIEESPDKLCIVKRFANGKHRSIMDFKRFNTTVRSCLITVKLSSSSSKSARDKVNDLDHLLMEHLPKDSFAVYLFSKYRPEERIHLFYPLHTVIKPGFPPAIRYIPSGMRPVFNPYSPCYRSCITALFDKDGNFVDDPKKDFTSYLVTAFNCIKSK
jgi:hypothetical protein